MAQGMDSTPPINSPQWWEEYFRSQWDANGGAEQTRHFMQRLVAELPAAEREHLRAPSTTILDWGCAHGEGVDELARAFGAAKVTGLDAAANAVAEASRRFPAYRFVHAPTGAIARPVDVVVTSNCLEHFAAPLPIAATLARAARDLLIVLVPYDEQPLCESHCVRFDEGSFPVELGGMRRLVAKRIPVDARHWGGDQLLVVYGSSRYITSRDLAAGGLAERDKWDAYYAATELPDESEVMARFGADFASFVTRLLPAGGRVLEAGAGAGWHSLALARTGRFEVTLLDFAENALRRAREAFAREGLHAEFVLGDAREHGTRRFDLVFNSGVLEHFAFEEQVRFVRAMASHSRNLVLALVPNRRCYWYWVWRLQAAAAGNWPFGREVPAGELTSVFRAAGLDVVGERVVGQDWTESFFDALRGADSELVEHLRLVHRSPLLADDVKGYLLAALGAIDGGAGPDPAARVEWGATDRAEPPAEAELTAALADALALQVRVQGELVQARQQHAQLLVQQQADAANANAHAAVASRLQERVRELEAGASAAVARHAELQQQAEHLEQELQRAREATARERDAAARDAAAAADARRACEQALRELDAARAACDAARAERDAFAAQARQLGAWQQAMQRSKSYRLLKAIDRARARLWPGGSRRP